MVRRPDRSLGQKVLTPASDSRGMPDPSVLAQSVWLRVGVTAFLVVTPAVCFLGGHWLLRRFQHDGLVERMIEEGYEHPGADEFLEQLGLSTADSETVRCPSCDFPTVPSLERCHVCDDRL